MHNPNQNKSYINLKNQKCAWRADARQPDLFSLFFGQFKGDASGPNACSGHLYSNALPQFKAPSGMPARKHIFILFKYIIIVLQAGQHYALFECMAASEPTS